VDAGSGQRKTPRGNLGGRRGRLADLSTVPSEGGENHQGNEESSEEEIAKGAE
jgi:hypothetical protein